LRVGGEKVDITRSNINKNHHLDRNIVPRWGDVPKKSLFWTKLATATFVNLQNLIQKALKAADFPDCFPKLSRQRFRRRG